MDTVVIPPDDEANTSTSNISLTSLAGSLSHSRFLCHLLEFDDAKILLDCGICDRRVEFATQDPAELERESIRYLDRLKECVVPPVYYYLGVDC